MKTIYTLDRNIEKVFKTLISLVKHILNPIPKRFRWLALSISIPILLVLGNLAVYQLLNPLGTKASWFDESWLYRIPIPISAHTAAENNVYITVTLDTATPITAGKMQSDCGDLRFTKENGELLPYFINASPGCNNAATTIQVNFDNFPAGAQTIYYYYGNASAPNGFNSAAFATAASGATIGSVGSEAQGPGPVAYWKFDDGQGTSTLDASPSQNTGTLGGTTVPTWQPEDRCIAGKCLFFDGSTSKVTGSKIAVNIQTVSFWIRPNTIATQGLLDLDGGTHKISTDASGVISAAGFSSPTYYINGVAKATPTLTINQWNHVVITTATGFNSTSTFTIGTDGTNFIKGFIDNVKFYPYARTAAQIKTDYLAGKANAAAHSGTSAALGSQPQDYLSNGLVGYWKMDEASGDITDSSGNGYTGTNNNTVTFPAGKFGNGTGFNGTNQNFTFSSLPSSTNFTIAAWVNIGSTYSSWRTIYADNVKGFWLQDRRINWYQGNDRLLGNTTLSTGIWYQVVITNDGSTLKAYLNGASDGSASYALAALPTTTANFGIGGHGGTEYFKGTIDEVRVYNRALTPAEIRQLADWAPGPVVRLKMDEGSGTSANDTSGNGRTGTLNGNPIWVPGKYGKGVKLDGTGDNVSVSDFGY